MKTAQFFITGYLLFAFSTLTLAQNSEAIKAFQYGSNMKEVRASWRAPRTVAFDSIRIFRKKLIDTEFSEIKTIRRVLDKENYLEFQIIDTTLSAYGIYDYYIKVSDSLGRNKMTSEKMNAHNLNKNTAPMVRNAKAIAIDSSKSLRLSWKTNNKSRIRNYTIYRSRDYWEGYSPIAQVSVNDTAYVDVVDEANEAYHYFVAAVDISGEKAVSNRFFGIAESSEKPLQPLKPSGKSTPEGVELQWKANPSNQRTFWVYRIELGEEKFRSISGRIKQDSSYTYHDRDSLLKGGRLYGYAIKAENDAFNFSEFSDTLWVRNGRSALEVRSLQLEGKRLSETENMLIWKQVKNQQFIGNIFIERRKGKQGQSGFQKIKEIPYTGQNSYIDTTATENTSYEYRVKLDDLYGNEGPSGVVVVPNTSEGLSFSVIAFRGEKGTDGVKLSWAIEGATSEALKIYKAEGNNSFTLLKEVISIGPTEFLDTEVTEGNIYFYNIIHENNSEDNSRSKLLSVKY